MDALDGAHVTGVLHARRVRRRIAAPRTEGTSLARIGHVAARLIPAARTLPAEAAGRAVVFAALGAFVLGTHGHGARALAGIPVGAYGGWRAGRATHERAARTRATQIGRDLPPLIDRLTTCVLAGMSVERALRTISAGAPGALREALHEGLRALDAGVPRSRAYELIAARSGSEDVRALTAALSRAERFGTSVSTALGAHARDLRARQRAEAEAESRTAPVKMIFPLVFCFLPAFVLLTIAPIAISAIRTIGGI